MSIDGIIRFHLVGRWLGGQIVCAWTASSFSPDAHVRELIERAWEEASAVEGLHLFDGPLCRLESYEARAQRLELRLSPLSYKQFFGTNMRHPELTEQYGKAALANPLGVSCALVSADGMLVMGKRNQRVAYYPSRVHPIAGAVEPRQPTDVFAEAQRELAEELGFEGGDVDSIACLGMVEDTVLQEPELVFLVQSTRTRREIERRLDAGEHSEIWALAPDRAAVEAAIGDCPPLTPVGVATILLWGRELFGQSWFDDRIRR